MAGLSSEQRDRYSVFPLTGKLLNVREASQKQIKENKEVQSIITILGLREKKKYKNTKSLRYGQLMIIVDQDLDGFHIKGLVINLFHCLWPSLLKVPSFMTEFITPIIKASSNELQRSFYSMREFEKWKEEELGKSANEWKIKYYKGLGSHSCEEGIQYFKDRDRHKKKFVWTKNSESAIELAFSKKKVEERKDWIKKLEPGTFRDYEEESINYEDLLEKEFILHSSANVQRSIPCMTDGLKASQRKILFCALKTKETNVAQFIGQVSLDTAYRHGDQNLVGTLIRMAQNYVGSNNINLLKPNGQFGSRYRGGKDHAGAGYLYTELNPIAKYIFPEDDEELLIYLNEDGKYIEPKCFTCRLFLWFLSMVVKELALHGVHIFPTISQKMSLIMLLDG